MTERDASMDDILASIRAAVTGDPVVDGPSVGVPPLDRAALDVSAESAPDTRGSGPSLGMPAGADASPAAGGVTVEALVRATLEPVLKAWLDAHLPEIVDRVARAEIARLIGRGG